MLAFEPVTPARLAQRIAERIVLTGDGLVRVAMDGPRCAEPTVIATTVAQEATALGRPAVVVDSQYYLRDASVRLEFGRTDVDAFADVWLDVDALNREVLDRSGSGSYLPALRDPASNRAARLPYVALPENAVVLVAGELLLGRGLWFDLSVHLATSSATRRRLTPDEWAWTLPAFDRYDAQVRPADTADAVVSLNDLHRPAIRWRASG